MLMGRNHLLAGAPGREWDDFWASPLFFGICGAFAVASVASFAVIKRMLRPMDYVAGAAERLARGDFAPHDDSGGGALLYADALTRPQGAMDELTRLMRVVNSLRRALKQRMQDLALVVAARERILGELALARLIQKGLSPKSMPKADNLETAGKLYVAQAVCGDMYDAFFRPPHELCLVLADVAARGIAAPILTGRVMPLLRELLLSGAAPGAALETVNHTLLVHAKTSAAAPFVSVLAGVLNTETGLLTWAGAGQRPPLLLRGKSVLELPWSQDVPVSLLPHVRYRNLTCDLRAGDALFFATDGLGAALSRHGEPYGDARLFAVLRAAASSGYESDSLLREVYRDVLRHAAPLWPLDDIALLVLRWSGPSGAGEQTLGGTA